MTFDEVAEIEPEVILIARQAKSLRGPNKLDNWYRDIKPLIVSVVGWGSHNSRHEVLGRADAYDAVYFHCLKISGA